MQYVHLTFGVWWYVVMCVCVRMYVYVCVIMHVSIVEWYVCVCMFPCVRLWMCVCDQCKWTGEGS